MTPRSLLTAIGATAIAFAVAIGIAAESSTGVNTLESSPVAFAAPLEHDRVGDHDGSEGYRPTGERLVSRNDPCVIAM